MDLTCFPTNCQPNVCQGLEEMTRQEASGSLYVIRIGGLHARTCAFTCKRTHTDTLTLELNTSNTLTSKNTCVQNLQRSEVFRNFTISLLEPLYTINTQRSLTFGYWNPVVKLSHLVCSYYKNTNKLFFAFSSC